ncbi:MucB/RseB C-terminal domain-containing protein [Methylomicrobium lacus]|uniref:MucB/RseB C-terminal domain-containing protein n=1 Tax=Methylomicrobium lacus TaxID=136992 RepID=UPI0035A8716C
MRALNYEGTVVFLRNGRLESMKYSHASALGREQERLVSLNSPLREIVRNGDQVSCRYNDTQTVVFDQRPFEHSFLVNFSSPLDEIAHLYDFVLSGEEDVAMFPAYVIDIRPKDEFRYARRIWVEKLQFLPLKVMVYDLNGALLEQVVFTEQHVKESLPFSEVNPEDAKSRDRALKESVPEALRFTVANPPAGFKEVYFARKTMHDSRLPVEHLRMTDGLASVSVYMENKNPEIESGLRSVGAVNFYSRNLDDYQVTVMGEVPPLTVKTIAEGIGLKSGGR